jgi:hypothetical protein
MSEVNQKYARLVQSLYSRSKAELISWEVPTEGKAQCLLGGYTIVLSTARTTEGEPVEIVRILFDGAEKEMFSDLTLKGLITGFGQSESYYGLMQDLRNLATRQALGLDKVIDDILEKLDSMDDVPF